MRFRLAAPTLDNWTRARALFEEFKSGRYADRVSLTAGEFEVFYRLHGMRTDVGVLLLEADDEIVGFAILQEVVELVGVQHRPRTLLRGVFVRPGLPLDATRMMYAAGQQWGRERGHEAMLAYVRRPQDGKNNFKMRAAARFGFVPSQWMPIEAPIPKEAV